MNAMPSVRTEQQHAGQPVQLARELEGAHQEYVRAHVDADEHDHGRRAPVVDAAHDAPKQR